MTKEIGFKFVPTFPSKIFYFQVRGYDKERDLVLTTVYTKDGHCFNDRMEGIYYDAAFDIGEYEEMPEKAEKYEHR